MKHSVLFSLMCGLIFNSFGQDYWQQKDSVKGSPRAVTSSFVIENIGFVVGGLDDFGFKRKMYSYDPSQDDWDDEVSLGGPNGDGMDRGSACSFSIGLKGYVCLGQGQTNPYFKDTWEYDAVTQTWSQKADFGGSARRQAVSFVIDDFAYVGTGQDATGLRKDFYRYDPALNAWTAISDFSGTARKQAVGFAMGAEGYIGTGDDGVLKNDFWQYQPLTDTWIQMANFPGTPRAGATAWAIFPMAYIATGEDNTSTYKNDVWEYSFYNNSWTQRANLPGPGRKNATSFVLNGIAYLGTGYNGSFLDDFYAYFGIAGIDENEIYESFAYPVPANQNIYITYEESKIQDPIISVYDLTGRLVNNETTIQINPGKIKIDVNLLTEGQYIYYLRDKSSSKFSTGKIIVN